MENREIARRLDEAADLLEGQRQNPFRVRAYRQAASTLRGLDRSVTEILRGEGPAGLTRIRGIGESLAAHIKELVASGRLAFLDRLRAQVDPEALLASVPGIGPSLASRLHRELLIAGLEDLELAAHDGRLRALGGFGPKRLQSIQDGLAGRLGGRPRRPSPLPSPPPPPEPSVAELLDVDAEYRHKAERGALPTIAPRRFNPSGEAWLPILHAQRDGRRYTVLFSNTARAHDLGTTRDWVVIYYDDGSGERQRTVVTERQGPLAGRRVVRGREAECRASYAPQALDTPRAA